jgi:hypothetical protein
MRRRIVEEIVDKAAQKVKSAVSAWFADAPPEKKR